MRIPRIFRYLLLASFICINTPTKPNIPIPVISPAENAAQVLLFVGGVLLFVPYVVFCAMAENDKD